MPKVKSKLLTTGYISFRPKQSLYLVIMLLASTLFSFSQTKDIYKWTDEEGESHCFKRVEGGALYLMRSGVETHRAEFDSADDCRHVAKIMNEAEPLVRWYCSTSVPAIEFVCNISNVLIKNTETGDVKTENFHFSMILNRNKATTSLTPAISSFGYIESAKYFLLTNDYPYANGNYFSRAVYSIKINRNDDSVTVTDINNEVNGEGTCRKLDNKD